LKNNKNIENIFNDKLNTQEFEIKDAWLNDMSEKIDALNQGEKKKKKGFYYYIVAGLILLIGTASTFLFFKDGINPKVNLADNAKHIVDFNKKQFTKKSDTNYSTQENKMPTPTINSNSENKKENQTIATSTNNTTKVTDEINTFNALDKEGKSTLDKSGSKSLTNDTPDNRNLGNTGKNKDAVAVKNAKNDKMDNASIQDGKSESDNNNLLLSVGADLEKIASDSSNNDIVADAKDDNATGVANTPLTDTLIAINNNNNNVDSLIGSNPINTLDSNTTLVINMDKTNADSLVPGGSNIIVYDTLNNPDTTGSLVNEDQNALPDGSNKLGIKLALTAGPSFLFRNFESENTIRSTQEDNRVTWNAGFQAYKTFPSKLIMGLGLNVINYGEKLSYASIKTTKEIEVFDVEENDYYNVELSNYQGVFTADTISNYTQLDTLGSSIIDTTIVNDNPLKANGNTNFTYIEIPLQIGATVFSTNRFEVNILAGGSTGFLINNRGSYLKSPDNIEKAKSNDIVFNLMLSTNLTYKLTNNLYFTFAPHFKYNINNLSTLTGNKRRYTTLGLNLGIAIDL